MISVHLEHGRVDVRRAQVPKRPKGFALIRLLCAGICNTDLELQRGYYSFVGTPGHEFVGEVVESGNPELTGKRVVGEINLSCGACDWCARDLGRHCPNRTVLGIVNHPGAFREYLTLPERNLHVVPDNVTNEQAVFAEPAAAACEILDQVKVPKGATVAVLGDGKLGLLISQVLLARRLHVVQFGRHRDKLQIAASAGADTRLATGKLPVSAFDWVVDATGSSEGLRTAVAMTRPRGTLILKSTMHGLVPVDTAPIIVNEITLIGSRCGRMEPALALLKARKLRVDHMITERFELRRAARAFERAAEKGVLKVLLTPES
ncbi:MAG: MDR/zinc-dependent alcohol dehydrogenase-like family protein [Bryobacteraceae bacterium]